MIGRESSPKSHAPVHDDRRLLLPIPPQEALHPQIRPLHWAKAVCGLRIHDVECRPWTWLAHFRVPCAGPHDGKRARECLHPG
eukprot:946335-Pleurochrysis_carterae.AAC.2